MTVLSKITLGVSPMFSAPRVLVDHRDVEPPPSELPVLPAGWCFLINADDNYIINADDNYIITEC